MQNESGYDGTQRGSKKERIAQQLGGETRRRFWVILGQAGAVLLVLWGAYYGFASGSPWSFPVILILIAGVILSLLSLVILLRAGKESDRYSKPEVK